MTDFSNSELRARSARRKPVKPADDSAHADPHPVHALQNSVGNRAVQRMLKPSLNTTTRVQTKLHVGAANDAYESEADTVAKQVVSQINAPVQRAADEDEMSMKRIQRAPDEDELAAKRIQRAADEDEMSMKRIQRAADEDELAAKRIQRAPEEEDMVAAKRIQRAEEDELAAKRSDIARSDLSSPDGGAVDMMGAFDVGGDTEHQINSMKGSGEPLPPDLSRKMGDAMGADFSGVKIHTGDQSQQLNQQLSAQAFTHGQDIFFQSGKYDPSSTQGQELLAHELTHVVQQSGNAVRKEEKP